LSSRACDFFDRFVFSAQLPDDFSTPSKPVILERSATQIYRITNGLWRVVEDPGDACWQMLF